LGDSFRSSAFDLWHANNYSRKNLRKYISVPDATHYTNNLHADDIDWQIESDFTGLANPGQVNSAIELAWRAGHVINYGDGVYGGVFVSAMHAKAYTASSIAEIIEAGRQAVPPGSQYRQVIEDVLAWHTAGNGWQQTWQLLQDKWGTVDRCPDGANQPFNIDAKLNGAYVLIGLLYGDGDFEKSMHITMRSGQDSDCNTSTVGGILGNYMGLSKIPQKWVSSLDRVNHKFSYTSYTFNDATKVNLEIARQSLLMNGGTVSGEFWHIPHQEAIRPPILEQWPKAPNFRPELAIAATAPLGRTVNFSASATDSHGILAYQWYFGDLTYADGQNLSYTYLKDGIYQVIAYVTDLNGDTNWKGLTVSIGR
jgi:ADP-ribosylglycohydrolase/PKD domain